MSKLCFECFKHFTTVSTAAALIVLALYQQFGISEAGIVISFGNLGASLLLPLIGMVYVPVRAGGDTQFLRSRSLFWVCFLLLLAAWLLFNGIITFATDSLGLGTLAETVLAVLSLSTCAVLLLFLRFVRTLG